MKSQFDTFSYETGSYEPGHTTVLEPVRAHVVGETDVLTDVVLCPPSYLAAVPCCAVTRHSLAEGFSPRKDVAQEQHKALAELLRANGVRCHMLPPAAGLADMCFTRDVAVSTPFGLTLLNPAMPHRKAEAAALAKACNEWRIPLNVIEHGTIEGGDICIAREGLLLIGMSGERSSAAGVDAFAAPFRAAGWDVIVCPFHADHLHLDTIFCMTAPDEAIGCLDLLDPQFVRAVASQGIRILPMPAQAARTLACNIVALGKRRIITSAGNDLLAAMLTQAGYHVSTVDVSEFAACGGGIHCLTMPLRRVPADGQNSASHDLRLA